MHLKWSTGNSKLAKTRTVGFSIPAYRSADGFATCPKAGACAAICYARQGMFIMPNVRAALEFNLSRARADLAEFVRMACEDLASMGNVKTLRIHVAGDMFSQEYLDAWKEIMRRNPSIKGYYYTKSIHLDHETNRPDNLTYVQSVGGQMDGSINMNRPHSRIFTTEYALRKAGYANGSHTDRHAMAGTVKIGLAYHGTRNLTPAQEEYFG